MVQQEIEAALEKVCSILPSTVKAECDDFVKTYAPMIVQLLVQELDPEQVCTVIGLCSQNHLMAVVKLVKGSAEKGTYDKCPNI